MLSKSSLIHIVLLQPPSVIELINCSRGCAINMHHFEIIHPSRPLRNVILHIILRFSPHVFHINIQKNISLLWGVLTRLLAAEVFLHFQNVGKLHLNEPQTSSSLDSVAVKTTITKTKTWLRPEWAENESRPRPLWILVHIFTDFLWFLWTNTSKHWGAEINSTIFN